MRYCRGFRPLQQGLLKGMWVVSLLVGVAVSVSCLLVCMSAVPATIDSCLVCTPVPVPCALAFKIPRVIIVNRCQGPVARDLLRFPVGDQGARPWVLRRLHAQVLAHLIRKGVVICICLLI